MDRRGLRSADGGLTCAICQGPAGQPGRYRHGGSRVLAIVAVIACDACLERSGLFGAELAGAPDDRDRRGRRGALDPLTLRLVDG